MRLFAAGVLALSLAGFAARAEEGDASARALLEVSPAEAAVGDRLAATLRLEAPEGSEPELAPIGPEMGSAKVYGGAWSGPAIEGGRAVWTWRGELAVFETGTVELPALSIAVRRNGDTWSVRTEPVEITIRSVLPPEAADQKADLADLKPPASIPGDYRPLWQALGALIALLAVSAGAWWLHRRYASRLAAVAAPEDPFRRVPPHEWAYAQLQRLLERRLAEEGRVDAFFEELSRILKRYLGGRYRVELMESTTEEALAQLRQAGCAVGGVQPIRVLLERCDRVKFAREKALAADCRSAVEEAYRVVDLTKPAEAPAPTQQPQKGAA